MKAIGLNNFETIKNFGKSISIFNTYATEFRLLNLLSTLLGHKLKNPDIPFKMRAQIISELFKELYHDSKRVAEGQYRAEEEGFIPSKEHLLGFIKILKDFPKVINRRKNKKYKLNNLKDYPAYFNRSFHFQTDGYTSEHSASMYEHQVQILFAGIANIMRKMFLSSLHHHFVNPNANVLELATGTGIGSRLLHANYPYMNILATDLSQEYIDYAKYNFSDLDKIRFQVADATRLNLEEKFDLVFHIFLLHELPERERVATLKEQVRVLRKGGLGIMIDSIQEHDRPEWKPILDDFPQRYHEPYYANYVKAPIEPILEELGLEIVDKRQILFSKCLTFRKP